MRNRYGVLHGVSLTFCKKILRYDAVFTHPKRGVRCIEIVNCFWGLGVFWEMMECREEQIFV